MTIRFIRRVNCAVLTLDRPQALNAMNEAIVDELEGWLDRLEKDDCRAIVLTGTGRAFCVGTDLKEEGRDPAARVARMHQLVLRFAEYPKVSVAALNGLTLGGGLELALACTFRVAAPTATLGLPEILLSLMPSYGATQLLPRLIGPSRALEMMLSGESIGAEAAHAIGLIDRVAEDVLDAAEGFAERCSAHGMLAQQMIRKAVTDGAGHDLAEGLACERALVARISASDEAREGIARFRARTKSA